MMGLSSGFAATYYVATTGNDVFPGTLNQPFLSIKQAISAAQPGDKVLVGPGNYPEDLSTIRNGTANARIVIDGQGTATVRQINFNHAYNTFQNFTVAGKNQQYNAAVWFRVNGHYSTLQNCVIDNGLASGFVGIGWALGPAKPFDATSASYCSILNNTVKNVAAAAMISIGGKSNLIQGNVIRDGAKVDFVRLWGENNIIRNNTFRNNYSSLVSGNHPDFIQTFGNGGDGSTGHIIDGNIIDGIQEGQLTQLEGNLVPEIGNWVFRNNLFMNIALQASCTIPDIQYYNNVFYRCNTGNGSHPLVFGSRAYEKRSVAPTSSLYPLIKDPITSGNIVEGGFYTVYASTRKSGEIVNGYEYQVICDSTASVTYDGVEYKNRAIFKGTGPTTYSVVGTPEVYIRGYITYNGIKYYHDTTFTANATTTFTTMHEGTVLWRSIYNRADGAKVYNNIFIECGDARNTRGWYGIEWGLKNCGVDYNYVAKADYAPVNQDLQKRVQGGEVNWDGMAWYEPHGINGGNPGFLNYAALDFRLAATSPLIDRGMALPSVPLDFAGTTRPQGAGYDIGAYEVSTGVSVNPVIAVSPTTLNFGAIQTGTTSTLKLTVQNLGSGTLTGSATAPAPYSIVSGRSYSLAAGQSQELLVKYAPDTTGSHPRTLSFTGGAGASVAVTGSGIEIPVITVTPAAVDFGEIQAGATATQSLTVRNSGTGTLTGSASVPAPYSIVADGSYSLPAGQSKVIQVQFAPASRGIHTQNITFTGAGGGTAILTGSATPRPPVVSEIIQNSTDVNSTLPGPQVYEGSLVQYNASAADPGGLPLSWQWVSAVNGGAETLLAGGNGPVASIAYNHNTGTAGNTVIFKLRVSNGYTSAESTLSVGVEAPPAVVSSLAFSAADGAISPPFVLAGGAISQAVQTVLPAEGGRAVFNFTLKESGKYIIQARVNAVRDGNNSFFLNIDAEPENPTMIWDIPLTAGFEQRLLSWRGNGTFNNNQFVPKTFTLSAGQHQLIIRGREADTQLSGFSILRVPEPPRRLRLKGRTS